MVTIVTIKLLLLLLYTTISVFVLFFFFFFCFFFAGFEGWSTGSPEKKQDPRILDRPNPCQYCKRRPEPRSLGA